MDFVSIKQQLNYELHNGNYSSSVGLISLLLINTPKHELPGLYYYLSKLILLVIDNYNLEKKNIAFITSFVSRSIENYLIVEGFLLGYDINFFSSHFYNYQTDIINPKSELYRFNPDIVVLFLRSEELLKDISILNYNDIECSVEKTFNYIQGIIDHLSEKIKKDSFIILHSLNYPRYSVREISLGELGCKIRKTIDGLNTRLQTVDTKNIPIYYFDQNFFLFLYGYTNTENEISNLVSQNPFEQLTYMHLTKEYMRYLCMHTNKMIKCLAVDADDTLWGGSISEDGIDNIKLGNYYPGNVYIEFQKYILELYNKGVILILLSKNDANDIDNVLDRNQNMILKKEHFASIKANWNKKSINLKSAAEELNIGLDSILFIDNSIHERNEMRNLLPSVKVLELPSSFEKYKDTLCDYIISEKNKIEIEDLKRNELYQRRKLRKNHEEKFHSLTEYYSSLNMKCCIGKVQTSNLGRAHDLLQRTNQFNLTTKRYSNLELQNLLKDPSIDLYYYTYEDIYGDDGIIGLIFINKDKQNKTWEIDTFLMSCRVLGKTIEDGIISHFIHKANEHKINYLTGKYIPTSKNSQIKDLYKKYGFEVIFDDKNSGVTKWRINVSTKNNIKCEWITIKEI